MFEKSSITQAVNSIYKTLQNRIIKNYNIDDVNESYLIADKLLTIHGLDKEHFNIISVIEKLIEGKINNNSIDDNSNKGEKTIKGILKEASNPIDKIVGYRYLYRKISDIYGKKEAKYLSSLMYDYTIALSDSTNILVPYCWSFDSSKLITIGKPFGQLPSSPVKRFDSYVSLANEVIHQMSNHLAGAISIGTFFLDIGHLLLLNENKTIEDLKNEQYRKYIKNQYQRFIHGVNSLSRSGGAECVTQDTEVLTPQGFKSYMDLKVGDDIYTWKDGKLNIQPVLRVNISEYSGNMIEFKGRDINQTVTQNHKVLYKNFNTNLYKLKDASELQKIKTPIDIPVAFNGIVNDVDYSISDELLKLITIVLCDGVLKKQEGKLTRIQILKSFNRYGQQEIENLLKTLKYEYSENIRISTFKNCNIPSFLKEKEYKIKVYNLSSQSSKEICSLLNETKKNIPDWFFKLSQRQAKIVLETWSKYDGHGDLNKKSEKIKLQCDNYDIADAIQHIAVLAGYGSRIVSRKIGNNKQKTVYVYIYKRKNKSAINKNIIPYQGIVWCPTTEDGIVVYRKEGRIFISGNSPFSNISLLDSVKLKKMISEEYNWYFMLEDGTLPYEVDYIVNFIIELQNIYMEFFDKGDPLNDGMPYRFPISTLNISKKKNKDDKWVIEDKNFLKRVCKKDIYRYNMFVSEGNKFASCCRLLSDIEMIELASQANSFGAGGSISIGSHRVVTLNIMRLALIAESVEHFYSLVGDMITNIKKILFAHKQLIKDSSELQHFIKIGWINLNRMFSTVGLIGYVEATETLMKKFGVQKDFIYEMFHKINSFVNSNNENFKGCTFNIEQIPAESMAHRLARADKILFGEKNVPYNIYANQIIPLWEKATIKERLEADGKCNKALTGGGIVHINTGEHITSLQAEMLVDLAVENNCEHFAITGTFCKCDDNHVIIGNKNNCAKCGKPIKQKIARTVGFFVDVDDMSSYKKEFDHDVRIEFTNGDFDIKGT